jgi:UPF0755 protein
MKRRQQKKNQLLIIFFFIVILCCGLSAATIISGVEKRVEGIYGAPDRQLDFFKRTELSLRLFTNGDLITRPVQNLADNSLFVIKSNESAYQIADRLKEEGYIADTDLFVDYLVYKGYDRLLNSGEFSISSGMSAIEIAEKIHSSAGDMTIFTILPGWRVEEIARAMEIYQFSFSPDELVSLVHSPGKSTEIPAKYREYDSLEGFLFPGEYKVEKTMSIASFLDQTLQKFDSTITPKMLKNYKKNGLSLYQAVTLASIIEKEAVIPEEGPMIASVFYNRLAAGMKLESDPTVQYAIGYVNETKTWWKNPLTADDLMAQSVYNTYQNPGLPPAPISNPGYSALYSVAFPETTNYYYFRAACDNSGKHVFSETFQEHLQNSCQ